MREVFNITAPLTCPSGMRRGQEPFPEAYELGKGVKENNKYGPDLQLPAGTSVQISSAG
jgi:hypothetical protein